jgi:hypothetical protein
VLDRVVLAAMYLTPNSLLAFLTGTLVCRVLSYKTVSGYKCALLSGYNLPVSTYDLQSFGRGARTLKYDSRLADSGPIVCVRSEYGITS